MRGGGAALAAQRIKLLALASLRHTPCLAPEVALQQSAATPWATPALISRCLKLVMLRGR